jgi:UDP-glucuronate 4-epimerase
MRILVTGGAGFIGSHLTERLLARGDEVVVFDDFNDYYDPALKRANLADAKNAGTLRIVEGDIRNAAAVVDVFENTAFDVVVHLAARAGVRPSLEDPLLYEEVNCLGTLRILEEMRRQGLRRLVFASSSSVYGNSANPPFTEDEVINRPISPYAATKAAGELLCYNYYHLYQISVTALRFFTVYGARQRPDMAIRKFTTMIDQGEPIPFYGDGSTERDYTYYTDIVEGVVASIDRDLGYEIVNLGESQTTSLSQLVGLIEENLGKQAVRNPLPMQPGDVDQTYADVSKARRLLDYNPTTPIADGIRAFVAWHLAQTS